MKVLFILLVGILLVSCSKEDDLQPSWSEKDYFDLSYLSESTDPVMQAIYSFWSETGTAVFCDDTIGQAERVDAFGNTYTYYETLSLNYSLGNVSGSSYPEVLSVEEIPLADRELIIPALDFIKEELLSFIELGGKSCRSLYLVNTLEVYSAGSYVFKGLNCVVLSKIPQMAEMTEEEKSIYVGEVAKFFVANLLMNSDEYASAVTEFENITRGMELSGAFVHFYTAYYYTWNISRYSQGSDLYSVGFLGEDPNYANCCPSSVQTDVEMYVQEIFVLETDEAFREKWADYPKIMEKYRILREILDELL